MKFFEIFKLVMSMIQCGNNHTVCRGSSGEVWVFGGNERGQLGLGHTDKVLPEVNTNLKNIVSISCGDKFTVCANINGEVYAFGAIVQNSCIPKKLYGLTNIRLVSCGSAHTACIDTNGSVFTFGLNNYGQLGHGDTQNRQNAVQICNLSDIMEVDCGAYHTICLNSSGVAFSFGRNFYGQLMLGTTRKATSPMEIPSLVVPIYSIACGADHTLLLLENDDVYGAGCNESGQLGSALGTVEKIPTKIPELSNIKFLSCGYNHTMCINSEKELTIFGFNSTIKKQPWQKQPVNKKIIDCEDIGFVYALSRGGFHFIFKGTGGSTWGCGRNDCGQLGIPPSDTELQVPVELPESLGAALSEPRTTAKSARK